LNEKQKKGSIRGDWKKTIQSMGLEVIRKEEKSRVKESKEEERREENILTELLI
jgi:hypothetical protein